MAGFCKSAKAEEIEGHGHVLTPGRYVGLEDREDDGVPIEEKLRTLVGELEEHFKTGAELEKRVRRNLKELGNAG